MVINIQDELQKIHNQYGTSEKSNYEIQKIFDNHTKGWVYLTKKKPIAYKTGEWDGKNSDLVVAEDKNGKQYLAHYCEGFMDGSIFEDWYSNDYLIEVEIVRFMEIPD
jgi:hypothetical protein